MEIKQLSKADRYHVRTYTDEDEIKLVRLFNKVYGRYAGFVPRTLEYWRWCCKTRPGVNPDGIAVIENRKKIVGYAVVAMDVYKEMRADILEFCYDSAYDEKTIVSKLLEWILKYVRSKQGNSVLLNVPVGDIILREACEERGFAKRQRLTFFLRVIDFSQLLEEIISHEKKISTLCNEILLIKLGNAPSWCDTHVTVNIQKDEVSVMNGIVGTPTIVIETDPTTITSCIFGVTSIFKAVLSSRLKVRPIWKLIKAWRFLSVLQLRNSWYVPRGDIG